MSSPSPNPGATPTTTGATSSSSPAKSTASFWPQAGPNELLLPPSVVDGQWINAQSSWYAYTHPSGRVYHWNPVLQVLTSDSIEDEETIRRLLVVREECISKIKLTRKIPQAVDMEISLNQNSKITFSNWGKMEARDQSYKILPTERFWQQMEKYPMHYGVMPPNLENEFLQAVSFGARERIDEFFHTTFPYNDQQTRRYTEIYQTLQRRHAEPDGQGIVPALLHHISKVMITVAENRTRYKYGTKNARVYRDIAVPPRSATIRRIDIVLTFLLLGTHISYRDRLEATHIKGVLSLPDFQNLVKSLLLEWADSNLLATVFVSANVGFLAVAEITSLQKTASLASSILAMMSLIAGVHHVWQHRGKTGVEPEEAEHYLHRIGTFSEQGNLTIVACFLCLPIVSLLWSVFSFAVAIAAYSVQDVEILSGRAILFALLGFVGLWLCVMTAFFWSIWREPPHVEEEEKVDSDYYVGPGGNPKPKPKSLWTRLKSDLVRKKSGVDGEAKPEKGLRFHFARKKVEVA